MVKEIWFDMDGTIADLYGVADWLPKLRAEDETPYREARPLVRMQSLARVLNRLQREGYTIGVVSWLSIGSSEDYDNRVANAKREWLARHLASVKFDRIDIMPHGTVSHTTNCTSWHTERDYKIPTSGIFHLSPFSVWYADGTSQRGVDKAGAI